MVLADPQRTTSTRPNPIPLLHVAAVHVQLASAPYASVRLATVAGHPQLQFS